jgi:hypothetical protein
MAYVSVGSFIIDASHNPLLSSTQECMNAGQRCRPLAVSANNIFKQKLNIFEASPLGKGACNDRSG